MLDMHNYILILCTYIVFKQNIIMLFDISIFPYLKKPTLSYDVIIDIV